MKTANHVELKGFIGNSPVVKTLKNGNNVVHLSIATDESYKNKAGGWVRNTTWHRVSVWNKLAEKVMASIKKGSCVALRGKLVNSTYTDKRGQKKTVFQIKVNAIDLKTAA